MVTPSGEAYATRLSRTCLVSSAACAGLSPIRISVAVGEARSYSSTSSTSRPISIGSSARDLEPGVGDASRGGEPARFGHLNPGEVGAESVPAAGGACREDGHLTAAASDVENVLPVLDLRGGEQSRPQPAQHPLVPLTLLDEFPPAGSVPVPGLLRIHRHERHATSPA
jgi:hypothetical protein